MAESALTVDTEEAAFRLLPMPPIVLQVGSCEDFWDHVLFLVTHTECLLYDRRSKGLLLRPPEW